MLPARIAVLNAVLNAEMIAGMIAGLHLCAVMTVVKTAGAVAEVGVAHPVPNPEGMTAAPLCVAMTAVDPVTDLGVGMIVHPCAVEGTGMVLGMLPAGMTAGMTAGLDSLLRRTHPQSVPPLSLKNGLSKKLEMMMVGHLSAKNNMYPYHSHTVQSK